MHKRFNDMSYDIFRRMKQSYDRIADSQNIYDNLMTYLLTKGYDHLSDVSWLLAVLEVDRKTTLFTLNTMQKMHICIDIDITASNKSNDPTNHVLGPLKLYICQHQYKCFTLLLCALNIYYPILILSFTVECCFLLSHTAFNIWWHAVAYSTLCWCTHSRQH